MSNVNISITFGESLPVGHSLKTVIKWDNSVAIADKYTSYDKPNPETGEPVVQFAFAPLFVTDMLGNWVGTWSANQISTPISNSFVKRISELQIPDEFTVDQKMEWLTDGADGDWGAPIRCTENWTTTTDARMIAAIYANQLVEVVERKIIIIDFNGKKEATPMSRIRTFTNADIGKTHKSCPQLVQKVTVVDARNNYGEKPKGTIYLPIYFGERLVWAMDRWLI